jgi:3-oxoacyl-[acyl-carrier protein] reductase
LTIDFSEKDREQLFSRIGLQRFASVDEIADAVLMLAQNQYITGSTLTIDGGLTYE